VGLKSLKRLNLTNGYPNNKNNKKKNNKVKSKPLELRSRVKNIQTSFMMYLAANIELGPRMCKTTGLSSFKANLKCLAKTSCCC
jgi:hypothetical protein